MTSRSVQESSGSSWERRPYDLTELIDSASASGGSGRPGGGHGDGSGRQTPPGAARWSRKDRSVRPAFVRMAIAFSFVICFGLVLYLGFRATGSDHWRNTSEWFQAALPATVSLLGSALGFYYGDKRNDR